jgi:lipoyl(octanoyl) transferase
MITMRHLGLQDYVETLSAMQTFTQQRTLDTNDEIWLLEHNPVYTLGQAGKTEHILQTSNIPIINSDRGGQVTYHAPGQLIAYVMLDLKKLNLNISQLVRTLESTIIKLLRFFDLDGHLKAGLPGVYINDKKIASIGLRVKNGYTYHGIALNVDLDLTPFLWINPCGNKGLEMTQIKNFVPNISLQTTQQILENYLLNELT